MKKWNRRLYLSRDDCSQGKILKSFRQAGKLLMMRNEPTRRDIRLKRRRTKITSGWAEVSASAAAAAARWLSNFPTSNSSRRAKAGRPRRARQQRRRRSRSAVSRPAAASARPRVARRTISRCCRAGRRGGGELGPLWCEDDRGEGDRDTQGSTRQESCTSRIDKTIHQKVTFLVRLCALCTPPTTTRRLVLSRIATNIRRGQRAEGGSGRFPGC